MYSISRKMVSNMNRNYYLLFFAAAAIITGCSKTTAPTANNQYVEYFPMSIGSTWTYKDDSTSYNYTNSIADTVLLSDSTKAILFTKFGTTMDSTYFKRVDNNIYIYDKNGSMKQLFLIEPIGAGGKWQCAVDSSGSDSAFVIDVDTLTTTAGILNTCYKIQYHLDHSFSGNQYDQDVYYWFAPGVGIVKMLCPSYTIIIGTIPTATIPISRSVQNYQIIQ